MRYAVFPNVDRYRGDIADAVSRASGMAVSVASVNAGWHGLRPTLKLAGVRVADRRGSAVFELARAEITLSWWSLLAGDLRFHDVDLWSPQLRLRRGTDGLIYLADKPLSAGASGEDGRLAAWLLGQPRLAIHDAALVWKDELTGAPEVELRQVEFAMRKKGARHRAALIATPPAAIAGRLDIRADLLFARNADAWEASGTLYGETGRVDLARMRAHLPLPEALRTATGRVRTWVEFEPGRVRDVTADLALRDVRAQLAVDALPLDLDTLSGRVFYRAQAGGYEAGAVDLAFRTRAGLVVRDADFSLASYREPGVAPRGEIRADGIDLKIAVALLDYLPVPHEAKRQANRYAPRGRLMASSFVWTGETLAQASAFRLRSRFENLAVNAVEGFPGVSGLTGTLEGDEKAGKLDLASTGVTFEAAGVFGAPLEFDSVAATATWKRGAEGIEVSIEQARFANADAEVTAAGTWRSLPGSPAPTPGWVDLAGRVERAKAPSIAKYVPNGLAETRGWLGHALLDGTVTRGRFELKGDLWHFPFADAADGHFLVEAAIEGGRLQYHPGWPTVDGIRGDIRFENARMEIRAREALIYASRARSARAVVASFAADPPVLEIDADIDTTGVDSVRFLRETPLLEGPGAFTRAVAIEGPARLALKLSWPLWGDTPFRVAGAYDFAGATASVGRDLRLAGIRGQLAFTESSVRAPGLVGTMFGQPATLRLATQPDGSVLTQLDGRMDAPALGAFVPVAMGRRLAGGTEWKARVVSGAEGTELHVESTLQGLAVGLPEPFAKRAEESRPLEVTIRRLGAPDEETVAAFAGGVHARIGRSGSGEAERWHVALKFGEPVTTEPVREGLWLYGRLARFDFDAWQEALAAPGTAPAGEAHPVLELQGIDVRFDRLRYTGREFRRMAVRLVREAGEWRGTLASPAIAGDVLFDPRGKGRIRARLERFLLEPGSSGEEGPEPAPTPSDDLPALDIVAARFEFRGRWLGRLELVARPDGEDWRIERLDISNDHARLASSGAWRRTAAGPLTRLDLKLDTGNLHALLEQFGFGEFVNRGEAKLEGQLVWPGYPNEFTPGMLSGRFRLEAARGQFARIEPGAGKLLGLLSLQSLPRRITFDFRDIFSDGFAFDRITGDVRLARGILLTQDFEIAGPSAMVTMAGEVSLPLETQNLTLKVVPEVGESVAIAATVLGTPVMGLTALLLQKLLQNPFGKAVSYEYLVTGSWDNPSVTRLGAGQAAAPAPAK